jgi:hypothetical protein
MDLHAPDQNTLMGLPFMDNVRVVRSKRFLDADNSGLRMGDKIARSVD